MNLNYINRLTIAAIVVVSLTTTPAFGLPRQPAEKVLTPNIECFTPERYIQIFLNFIVTHKSENSENIVAELTLPTPACQNAQSIYNAMLNFYQTYLALKDTN